MKNKSGFHKLMGKDKPTDLNQNHIILGFFEFDFSPDTFTKEMELEPLEKGLKGDKYFVGPKKEIEKIHDYNIWTHELKTNSTNSIGHLIEKYIDEIIKPRVDTIKRLTKSCNVQLRIVQYYYDGYNPGIYLKPEHNKILADINSSIDIDIYCFGESKPNR
ncbi:MAG: DUF4279 domain-containing protein [Bacteroidota bacterium]|nr:DUF4279 domain-containing protein [Bacteroidota bacterium]